LLRERMLPVKGGWTNQSFAGRLRSVAGRNLEASPGGKSMIIEMRTYKTKPGMRSQFLEIFRAKSIPAHAEIGMKILGPYSFCRRPRYILFYARLS
jgi:hypothetical protein